MDEEEFISALNLKPFGTADAARMDARSRRLWSIQFALCGCTASDAERQLNAPHPQIPKGIGLSDLREVKDSLDRLTRLLDAPRAAYLSSSSTFAQLRSATVHAAGQLLTLHQAHCEIVRCAIVYLEGR